MSLPADTLLAKVEHASFFRDVAPDLHVDAAQAPLVLEVSPRDAERARLSLDRHGYFSLDGALSPDFAAALSRAATALEIRGVPALFLFAYDEPWAAAFAARDALVTVLGERYALIDDVWAWRVPKAAGARGWKPHRGTYEDNRRHGAAPSVINAWVALSDVTLDAACMHVVPLDRDPHAPGDLASHAYDPSAVVPLPAAPGTLLAWSSNVLHWGGDMTERAPEARVSLSFSLSAGGDRGLARAPAFRERIDLLADLVAVYGDNEGPDFEPVREWARLNAATRALGRRPRSS